MHVSYFSRSFAIFLPKDGDDKHLEPCSDIVKMVGDLLRLGVVDVDRRLVPLWTVFNCGDEQPAVSREHLPNY